MSISFATLSFLVCYCILMQIATAFPEKCGNFPSDPNSTARALTRGFKILQYKYVNTTIVRNANKKSATCTWKFLVSLPKERFKRLACLVYDSGKNPFIEQASFHAYGKDFQGLKASRPLSSMAPFLFTGYLAKDPDSSVLGTITRGGFIGQIRIKNKLYFVEHIRKFATIRKSVKPGSKTSTPDRPDPSKNSKGTLSNNNQNQLQLLSGTNYLIKKLDKIIFADTDLIEIPRKGTYNCQDNNTNKNKSKLSRKKRNHHKPKHHKKPENEDADLILNSNIDSQIENVLLPVGNPEPESTPVTIDDDPDLDDTPPPKHHNRHKAKLHHIKTIDPDDPVKKTEDPEFNFLNSIAAELAPKKDLTDDSIDGIKTSQEPEVLPEPEPEPEIEPVSTTTSTTTEEVSTTTTTTETVPLLMDEMVTEEPEELQNTGTSPVDSDPADSLLFNSDSDAIWKNDGENQPKSEQGETKLQPVNDAAEKYDIDFKNTNDGIFQKNQDFDLDSLKSNSVQLGNIDIHKNKNVEQQQQQQWPRAPNPNNNGNFEKSTAIDVIDRQVEMEKTITDDIKVDPPLIPNPIRMFPSDSNVDVSVKGQYQYDSKMFHGTWNQGQDTNKNDLSLDLQLTKLSQDVERLKKTKSSGGRSKFKSEDLFSDSDYDGKFPVPVPKDRMGNGKQQFRTKAQNGLHGINWNLNLVADHRFYTESGNKNIRSTVGRMMYFLDQVEWILRSMDWDGDGLPDNFGFIVKNVIIELEAGSLRDNVVRFGPVLKNLSNDLTIGFTAHSDSKDIEFFSAPLDTDAVTSRTLRNLQGCAHQKTMVVAVVNSVDSSGKELPDSFIIRRMLEAILRAIGGNRLKTSCKNVRNVNGLFFRNSVKKSLSFSSLWDFKIHPCVRRQLNEQLKLKLACRPNSDLNSVSIAYCGNGILETGEQCDCGFASNCLHSISAANYNNSSGCCNPRGNILKQCKFTANSSCYDPSGICCNLETCVVKDLTRDGLSCRIDTCPTSAAGTTKTASSSSKSGNNNQYLLENSFENEIMTQPCGALTWSVSVTNRLGAHTNCFGAHCQSDECSRLGLHECICDPHSSSNKYNGTSINFDEASDKVCSTCCRSQDLQQRCLPAQLLTQLAVEEMSNAFNIWVGLGTISNNNGYINNQEITDQLQIEDPKYHITFEDYLHFNVSAKGIWDRLQTRPSSNNINIDDNARVISKSSSNFNINFVEENTSVKEYCIRNPHFIPIEDFKPACIGTTFLHWPVNTPCVVLGTVSVCGNNLVCPQNYKIVAVDKEEVGPERVVLPVTDKQSSAGQNEFQYNISIVYLILYLLVCI